MTQKSKSPVTFTYDNNTIYFTVVLGTNNIGCGHLTCINGLRPFFSPSHATANWSQLLSVVCGANLFSQVLLDVRWCLRNDNPALPRHAAICTAAASVMIRVRSCRHKVSRMSESTCSESCQLHNQRLVLNPYLVQIDFARLTLSTWMAPFPAKPIGTFQLE
jgi:hypothetical protein